LQEAEKRQKIRELMLDSTIFSVITHALLTESQPRRKACRITETPRSAQIAQLVEQRIENPRVRGSNPRLGTTFLSMISSSYAVLGDAKNRHVACMLHEITKHFQCLQKSDGKYVQHGCNMERQKCSTFVPGKPSYPPSLESRSTARRVARKWHPAGINPSSMPFRHVDPMNDTERKQTENTVRFFRWMAVSHLIVLNMLAYMSLRTNRFG
jgi:hypothetical protein